MTAQPSTPVHISHHQPTQAEEVFRLLQKLASLLAPTPRTPQTYYVSPTGSDSAACTQSAPCRTVAEGIRRLHGGDTLYLRAGTYAEHIGYPNNPFPPSGLSWEQPTTIAGYPGEQAILKPPSTVPGVIVISKECGTCQYMVFHNLVADGTNINDATVNFAGHHYMRLSHSDVFRSAVHGSNIAAGGTGQEFLYNKVHGSLGYGWYFSGRDSLFEGNTVYDQGGYGLHMYSAVPEKDQVHRNTVRGNTFTNCGFNFVHGATGQRQYLAALIVSSGGGHKVYNNLVYGNYKGIQVDYSSGQTVPHEITHNTLVGNQTDGLYVGETVTGAVIRNNILWRNGATITDRGSGTVMDHNLTTDPRFVNEAAGDYHLQAGSPALDAGVAVAGVTTDKDGVARPQGPAPDLGAYERVVTPVPPQPSGAMVCTGELAAIPSTLTLRCVPDISAAGRTP